MRHAVDAVRLLVAVGAITTCANCGSSPTPPSGPPVLVETSFTISGNLSFTGTGQETQLKATAGYSDGTTKDVTASVAWSARLPTVAQVSSAGALTTTGLGATYVDVRNTTMPTSSPLYFRTVVVTVTPPGTSAFFGWTREPGSGPLSGVLIRDPSSGQSTTSNNNGEFALGGLMSGVFTFTKAGYEDVQFEATPSSFDDWPIQKTVRIAAGESTQQKLAPHDVDYEVTSSTHCQPCRLIRVTSVAAGTLRLRLTWTDASATLNLWVNGQLFASPNATQEVVADVPVGVGELQVYAGKIRTNASGNYVPFTLSTTR